MRFANRMVFELGLAITVAWASSVSLAEAGINVWTSNGPEGDVYALAIDPRTPSTLYAGTEEGGISRASMAGDTGAPSTPA